MALGNSGHSLPLSLKPSSLQWGWRGAVWEWIPERRAQGGKAGGMALQRARGCRRAGTRQESWGARGRKQCAITWCGGQAQISVRDPLFHPSLNSCSVPHRGSGSPLWQPGVTRNGKCHFLVGPPEAPPGPQHSPEWWWCSSGQGEGDPWQNWHPGIPGMREHCTPGLRTASM